MQAGDRIRLRCQYGDLEDFTLEEFRFCLGIFYSKNDRTAQRFTPLCELYEPAPESKQSYLCNYGEYHTSYVPSYMEIPK